MKQRNSRKEHQPESTNLCNAQETDLPNIVGREFTLRQKIVGRKFSFSKHCPIIKYDGP